MTQDPKWTPGPWYQTDGARIRQMSSDGILATMDDGGHIDPDVQIFGPDQIEANATLIAAAPEIYEALDDALNWMIEEVECLDPRAVHDLTNSNRFQNLSAALAKARGEAQ